MRMRRWVCVDWYFESDHMHVATDDSEPKHCYFKHLQGLPQPTIHTIRCGVQDITMTRVKEDT